MNAICTAGSEHIRAADFREWLVKANPGDRIVYCTGELAKSLHFAFLNKDPNAPALEALQQSTYAARDAALKGGKSC
jgi:hypothetical protein